MNLFDCHTHHLHASGFSILDVSVSAPELEDNRPVSLSAHPMELTDETANSALLLFGERAGRSNVAALGEVGLDKRSEWLFARQISFLKEVIHLSEEVQKPLILHGVRAMNELTELRLRLRPRQAWVLHGFRGNSHLAHQLLNAGFYLSYGEHFHREALLATPAHRLLIETDESALPLDDIYRSVSAARNIEMGKLVDAVWENGRQVFSIA